MSSDPTMRVSSSGSAERTVEALKKEYTLVGKRHIKGWHIWLIVGIVAGIAAGVVLVASRTGEFSPSEAAGEEDMAETESFSLFGLSRRPRLKVIAPNGGEVWPQGSLGDILWCGKGKFPEVSNGRIWVERGRVAVREIIFSTNGAAPATCPALTAHKWTVPTLEPGSDYGIRIDWFDKMDTKLIARDRSDAPFSIVAQPVLEPSFWVALDKSTPPAQTVPAGSLGVPVTALSIFTSGVEIELQQIALQSEGSFTAVKVGIWDGTTKVGETIFAATGTGVAHAVAVLGGVVIPTNRSKVLTIKADIPSLGSPVKIGDTIVVNYDGDQWQQTKGVAKASGNVVFSSSKTDTVASITTIGPSVTPTSKP